MFGRDADDKDIFSATSDFYRKIKLDYFQGTSIVPFPGTGWYNFLKPQNRVLYEGMWELWEGLHVVHKPAKMTPYELQQGIIQCYKDFYSPETWARESARTLTNTLKGAFSGDFPSWYPAMMRIFGTAIVKNWIKHNRGFLKELEKMHAKRDFQSFLKYSLV
jgi:hypothetical protein